MLIGPQQERERSKKNLAGIVFLGQLTPGTGFPPFIGLEVIFAGWGISFRDQATDCDGVTNISNQIR